MRRRSSILMALSMAAMFLPLPLLLSRGERARLQAGSCACRCRRDRPKLASGATEGAAMEQRNLGTSGLRVSVVGLGCNNFGNWIDQAASQAVVHKALDLGITLLDTADAYGNKGGSETILGEILGPRRKDIVLATKFGLPMDDAETLKGGSRRYVVTAVEASLKRLKTDWIDLYQLHRPDPLTPIEETLRALDDLVRHGKVRYLGCSNLVAWQVADAEWVARSHGLERFISAQNLYSLLDRTVEAELVPA